MTRRRLHVFALAVGDVQLADSDAHHARDVLRLTAGSDVELFDDAGNHADARITSLTQHAVIVHVDRVERAARDFLTLTIASAIPKGERADWMIEKLSELGVSRFIPLLTDRGVTLASGKNKLDRWRRIAIESAKQSERAGVMKIDDPTKLIDFSLDDNTLVMSTEKSAKPIIDVLARVAEKSPADVTMLIGPEGDWSEAEVARFRKHKLIEVKLTATILRVETAAITAAAVAGVYAAMHNFPEFGD